MRAIWNPGVHLVFENPRVVLRYCCCACVDLDRCKCVGDANLVASAVGCWSSPASNAANPANAHDRLLSAVLVPWGFLWDTREPSFLVPWGCSKRQLLVPVDSCKRTSGDPSLTMCGLEISDLQTLGGFSISLQPACERDSRASRAGGYNYGNSLVVYTSSSPPRCVFAPLQSPR